MVGENLFFSQHSPSAAVAVLRSYAQQPQWWLIVFGWVALVWYGVVTVVCLLGYVQLQRNFSQVPPKSVSTSSLPWTQIPHVTILRPIKGSEPYLYECLAASLRQNYPRDKLTVYFCISSVHDPAFLVVRKVLADFPHADAKVYIEPEYSDHELGPNPKIRNMSKAYNEAKGDIVWIVDCNVWLGSGVCGRMVDRLCGLNPNVNGGRKYKFVHHLPIVVDVDVCQSTGAEDTRRSSSSSENDIENLLGHAKGPGSSASAMAMGGGRLEELFLSSSHAKMYSAINTVLVAPCIIGKSSMFRRSHLNYLTDVASGAQPNKTPRPPGIDYFSDNICEDHLIGDRLWKGKIREEAEEGEVWGKHNLAFGDIAIQPMSGMSVHSYIDRRVRWLRVRKFTVLLATLVEPGTEAFLCSLYLAFGVTTVLPQYCRGLETWSVFFTVWILSILSWIALDWSVYLLLHSATAIEVDEHTPPFARANRSGRHSRRPFTSWLPAWLGREALALPIWIWAIYGGSRVVWRDRAFKVGMDTVAREIIPRHQVDNSKSGQSATRSYPIANGEPDGDVKRLRRRTPNGSVDKPSIATNEVSVHR